MVRHIPSFSIRIATANTFGKDGSAFLIIVYSARYRGSMRVHGMRGLIDTIVEDATVYFLLIFTGHILVILFEYAAPVSDHLVDLCSSTHCKFDTANDSRPPSAVSHHLEPHNNDELDGILSYLQRNYPVSLAHRIKFNILLTLFWDSLMPSMITRLVLSLKKAAISPDSVWSGAGTSRTGTAMFFQGTVGGTERTNGGDVALSNLSSEGASGLSRNDDQII